MMMQLLCCRLLLILPPFLAMDPAASHKTGYQNDYSTALQALLGGADADVAELRSLELLCELVRPVYTDKEPGLDGLPGLQLKPPEEVETLLQANFYRQDAESTNGPSEFNDTSVEAFGTLVESGLTESDITKIMQILRSWAAASETLNFADADDGTVDEIGECARAVGWVVSKAMAVARCMPIYTCSPEMAWHVARAGRAAAGLDTKWSRSVAALGMRITILQHTRTLSEKLQRLYEVGSDFGGWKSKQLEWDRRNREL